MMPPHTIQVAPPKCQLFGVARWGHLIDSVLFDFASPLLYFTLVHLILLDLSQVIAAKRSQPSDL